LEEGCKRDVELTYQIFMRLLPHVSQEELEVIDLTIRMYTEPKLELNKERMNVYLQKTIADKDALLKRVGVDITDLSSSAKFASVLRGLGVEPPVKTSAKTGKETYALAKTDKGFKALCESEDDMVAALCAARLGVKSTLAESRAGRMLGSASRGPLPVYLKYYGAHTGRWSGGDKMNWQNFPRGGEIRKSILAPEGYMLVVVDLSQIECRMVNWLAGQEDVLDAFRSGRDIYCESASRFYGRAITKADNTERQIFKSVELGCGYGMGSAKFREYARQTGSVVTEAQADELIKFYRHTHEMVCRFWRKAESKLEWLALYNEEGTKETWGPMELYDKKIYYPNGGYQSFSDLHRTTDREWHYTVRGRDQKIYGGLLTENVTQALSRVLLSQAMLKISKRYKVVMSTHDEVVYLAPEAEAKEAYDFGVKTLTTNPDWCKTLPLAAEGGYAKEYSK
jgi:DNA polymerase